MVSAMEFQKKGDYTFTRQMTENFMRDSKNILSQTLSESPILIPTCFVLLP